MPAFVFLTLISHHRFNISLIALTTLLCYSNSFAVPFVFDDIVNIVNNPSIRNISNFFKPLQPSDFEHDFILKGTVTRFIGYLSFALNYELHGLEVWGYHAFNLLIHIVSAVGVYCLVILLMQSQSGFSQQDKRLVAIFTALLFACHPIQTQAVTYIVQRFASLASMFYVLAVVFYLLYRQRHALTFYLLSLLCTVSAMKTKEIAFTLPFMLVAVEYIFCEGSFKRRIIMLLPFLASVLIIPLSIIDTSDSITQSLAEASQLEKGISRLDYLLTQFSVIVKYLQLLILPIGQNLDHDHPVLKSLSDVWLYLLLLTCLGAMAVIALFKGIRQKNLSYTLMGFGIIWFFVTLSIESSIIPITDVMFEHRLYLPSVGFFLSVVVGLHAICSRYSVQIKYLAICLSMVVVILAILTYNRNTIWQSRESIWADAAAKSPNKARTLVNYGVALLDKGSFSEARDVFERATRLQSNYARAWGNLSSAYLGLKDYENARIAASKAILFFNKEPDFHFNLAISLIGLSRHKEAVDAFITALKLKPTYVNALMPLASTLIHLPDDEALQYHNEAYKLNPQYAKELNKICIAYYKQGSFKKAKGCYLTVISLDDQYPAVHYNLGLLHLDEGRYNDAIREFSKALSIDPNIAIAYLDLGTAYQKLGNTKQACEAYSKALTLDNNNQEAKEAARNLGC